MLYCRDSTEEHLEIWKKTSGKKENQEESIETAEHNKNRHFRNEKGAGTRQLFLGSILGMHRSVIGQFSSCPLK